MAAKRTRMPGAMSEADVEARCEVGGATALCSTPASFDIVNRIAMRLGIETTPEEGTGYDYDPTSTRDAESCAGR